MYNFHKTKQNEKHELVTKHSAQKKQKKFHLTAPTLFFCLKNLFIQSRIERRQR